MLASSISQGLGAGLLLRGFCAWAAHGLQFSFRCQVILRLMFAQSFLFPLRPSPPSCHGKYVVSICVSSHCLFSVMVLSEWLPLTGLSWIPYAFGSVSLMAPSLLFLGTIPKAHLLLTSLRKC